MTRQGWASTLALVAVSLARGILAADASEIALSFVHKEVRIDVPADAVRRIEAYATLTIVNRETRQRTELESPRVEICLSKAIRDKLSQLTARIVDQPLDIVVGCEVVSRPVIREPMGVSPCFQITANDAAEADAIARKLRSGSKSCRAPTS